MPRHEQLDFFAELKPALRKNELRPGVFGADPDEVRAELLVVLAKLRAAQRFPWDESRTMYWRTVFPQMTNWLPDEEAARLRSEFQVEMQRLDAA